jgi:hypothetical protein
LRRRAIAVSLFFRYGMIRKSGNRFSEKIMRKHKSTIRKSGNRFSEKIMRKHKSTIRKSGNRFSEKIMRKQ